MRTPIKNEIWQHHSGRLYEIVCVANEKAESWETEVCTGTWTAMCGPDLSQCF